MSHELRTPMHAILNFAEMGKIRSEENKPEKIMLYFVRIEESGERLLRLINGLLDLTRLESGKVNFRFEPNNMVACIEYVQNEMTALLEKKGIQVVIQKDENIPKMVFDKDHIIRVLINILSNAIKFSPENSSITITVGYGKYKIVGNSKKAKGLMVSVDDNGAGIEEDEKDIIFNKFIQGSQKYNKEAGSGIGLAICKEIISSHKGNIWAENRSNGGARINFIIPE